MLPRFLSSASFAASRNRGPPSIIWCSARRYGDLHSKQNPGWQHLGTVSSQGHVSSNPVQERYHKLVSSGVLSHDPSQVAVVERLSCLYDDVIKYRQDMASYHVRVTAYQAERRQRLQQLAQEAHGQAAKEAGGEERAGAPPAPASTSSSGWFSGLWSSRSSTASPSAASASNAAQQARQQAVEREARVTKEMGPPPSPPPVPQGVYLHGSVGSGKSLLMDLFYDALSHQQQQQDGAPPAPQRRMHFNAAMLEVHSRLHQLDQQRVRELEAANERRAAEQHHGPGAQPGGVIYDDSEAARVAAAEGAAAAAVVESEQLDSRVADPPTSSSGIFRYWDSGVQRQREAKAAFLAVRRHLRSARTKGVDRDALAAANAANLVEVASSFIHGGGDGSSPGGAQAGGASLTAAVLCFDELQVTDVFTAAALKGLFEQLRRQGCVVVATSNRAPQQLQRHGLHEVMFDNFIATLYAACDIVELSTQHDYRRLLLQGVVGGAALGAASTPRSSAQPAWPLGLQPGQTYLSPLGHETDRQLRHIWQQRTAQVAGQDAEPRSVEVMFGRRLSVTRAAGGAAWFTFEELCAQPRGAADYIALAARFHTVVLCGVPAMSMQVRDQARRFITLVDELYNGRCALVCSAAVAPDLLFAGADHEEPILDLEQLQFEGAAEGARLRRDVNADGGVAPVGGSSPSSVAAVYNTLGGADEKFAFSRAVSRLYEMQSAAYLSRCRAATATS